MTKTEELLKLAEAAMTNQGSFDKAYAAMNAFDAAANPATIKQLVELVRMQHEILDGLKYRYETGEFDEAIAAYERFEKGE